MKTTVSLLLTLCLLPVINFGATNPTLSPTVAPASPQYLEKIAAFEEFVRQQMQKDKIPGLTIGFFKDEDGWANGFGYADLENKTPARADSAYRLANARSSRLLPCQDRGV